MKNKLAVVIRPIAPGDEPLLAEFHRALSERSVYMRYLHILPLGNRVEHERLARVCHADQQRETVLVAENDDSQGGGRRIIGVGRWNRFPGTNDAEIAVLVADEYQNSGVGTEMIRRLAEFARAADWPPDCRNPSGKPGPATRRHEARLSPES